MKKRRIQLNILNELKKAISKVNILFPKSSKKGATLSKMNCHSKLDLESNKYHRDQNSKDKSIFYKLGVLVSKARLLYMEGFNSGHLKIRKLHDVTYQKGGTYKSWSDKPYSSSVHKAAMVSFIASFIIFSFAQNIFPNLFDLTNPNNVLAGSTQKIWDTLADFTNNNGATGNIASGNIDLNNGDPKLSTATTSSVDTSFSAFSTTGNATTGSTISLGIPTVTIGTQTWMKYNLNVGTMLASAATVGTNNGTPEKWCYNNDPANCTTYGGLYSWDEMMGYTTTAGTQGICPTGFHLPTDAEQYTLESYLATGTCSATRSAWDCAPAGTALKPGGSSGFEGLLSGYRNTNGSFYYLGSYGYFWSSSESGTNAWRRNLDSAYTSVYRNTGGKAFGFSVRCLKN